MATGGLDSTTLLYKYKGLSPTVITVDYGQLVFEKQIELLNHHITKLSLPPLVVIKIPIHDWQARPGLFQSNYVPNEVNPLADWDKLRYADFFVEGRNSIMLTYALAYCSANKIDELLLGYLYGEAEWMNRRSYKLLTGDNSPQFVDIINLISQLGYSHQVRVRAPFYELRWDKTDVIVCGREMGVDYNKTYSCYFTPPCGRCDNCLLRKELGV